MLAIANEMETMSGQVADQVVDRVAAQTDGSDRGSREIPKPLSAPQSNKGVHWKDG